MRRTGRRHLWGTQVVARRVTDSGRVEANQEEIWRHADTGKRNRRKGRKYKMIIVSGNIIVGEKNECLKLYNDKLAYLFIHFFCYWL